jgi:spore germination protein YaaH
MPEVTDPVSRRLTALLLLATLLVTSSVAPGAAIGAEPDDDVSVLAASGRHLPPMPEELRQPSVHAEMLATLGSGSFDFEPGGPPSILLNGRALIGSAPTLSPDLAGAARTQAAGLPNGLRKEVFGFLPYWMLTDSALAEMKYSLVSTIAYFSVNVNRDGYLIKGSSGSPSTGWAGWTSSRMTQVLNAAHASGVRVVLTVTMMAWDSASAAKQERVLTSATRRARLVNQIVSAVRNRGADGVNLDFEPLATSLRDEYVKFVKQLKAGLESAGVGDYLTVCVMAGAATWATGYDVAGLTSAGAADALFVMGYDYHWSGSSRAGGVAPIHSPYTLDVNGTMLDFLAETSGSKLIWGVPYYGRTWRTTKKTLNSPTLNGGSKAYTYTGHRSQASRHGRRWDDVGRVPWYRYWDGADGNWVQGYYDDRRSLGIKYDLINQRGLAGTGMWTLLMDQGRDELWRLLADKFVHDTDPPIGGIRLLKTTTDGLSVKVRWKATDFASGVDRYTVQVRPVGGAWQTWLRKTEARSAWFTGEPAVRYEFRVKAVDHKGNAQPWVSVPGKPAKVKAGAFARVVAETLNVRAGPGTSHQAITQAVRSDRVYVLEGPVAGSGLEWYRVQYGFAEWPSSDYPRIGWMALGAGGEDYLKPAAAPTITRLSPFVRDMSATSAFSPNGDGRQDVARIEYSLQGAADTVRLEVIDADGDTVRTVDLGAKSAGAHVATWDGKVTGGSVAPEGTYRPRIVAVEGGVNHYGPAASLAAPAFDDHWMRLDVTRPRVDGRRPGPGTELVPVTDDVVIDLSEPIGDLGAASFQILDTDDDALPVNAARRNGGRRVVLTTDATLPVGSTVTVAVSSQPTDAAGNPVEPRTWTFITAPGTAYDPPRTMVLRPGTHVAYEIGADGRLSTPKAGTYSEPGSPTVGQRAQMPNLPGRWLHVEGGRLGGRWLRESAAAHLPGVTERDTYDAPETIVLRKGRHTGLRFDTHGDVSARRRVDFTGTTTAQVAARRIVNGTAYLRVVSGRLAGYLVRESRRAYRPGLIERINFPDMTPVVLSAGAHTGFRYASDGDVTDRETATASGSRHLTARAWAVINGVAHFRIVDGAWAGTWVPESSDVRLDS